MGTNTGTVMTIANSIIGVSVLAMPFCFKECGIFLSILMLVLSSILSRLTCYLVLKAAVMSRRRNFEFLAFHIFGTTGKFLVELCIIGFLMGTCIAFFVVVGDLGPAIIAKTLNMNNTSALRPSVLIGLAFLVVLPLGLLRNVDSLSSICTATIGFYVCLVLKVVIEALPHLKSGIWIDKVEYWRPAGILQCLPIFSMALFCQTQLFEIYETMPNASLERMNGAVRSAINICTGVYISVGFFGYVAFCTETFSGNVLMSFSPSMMSDIIKVGFVLSVAVSFPLVIFPCRASLYSLLFRRIQVPHHEAANSYIPEARFKCITIFIISVSLVIGLLIPNIELVLGLVGSTIGVGICVIFPTMAFIFVSTKETTERITAQVLFFVGVLILILGTYATLFAKSEKPLKVSQELINPIKQPDLDIIVPEKINISPNQLNANIDSNLLLGVPSAVPLLVSEVVPDKNLVPAKAKEVAEVRQEPPVPVEPVDDAPKILEETKKVLVKEKELPALKAVELKPKASVPPPVKKQVQQSVATKNKEVGDKVGNDQVINKDALNKEDEALAEAENEEKADKDQKNNELLMKLEHHKEEQQKLLEEQKMILLELKEHKKEVEKEKEKEAQPNAAPQILMVNPVEPQVAQPKLEPNKNLNEQPPNLPKFGYTGTKDEQIFKKSLPPKQPIAYQPRFASNEVNGKQKMVPVSGNIANSINQNNNIIKPNQHVEMPSIKSLLIPANEGNQPIVPDRKQTMNKKIPSDAEPKSIVLNNLSKDQRQEIDNVKNMEILKSNNLIDEAKVLRRDILGTGGRSEKVEHEREKRETELEEEQNKIINELSLVKEISEQQKAPDENCELNEKTNPVNKTKDNANSLEPARASEKNKEIKDGVEVDIKISSHLTDPVIQPVKELNVDAVIKLSSHLMDPVVPPVKELDSLNKIQKDSLENDVKPMTRDLKSILLKEEEETNKKNDQINSS